MLFSKRSTLSAAAKFATALDHLQKNLLMLLLLLLVVAGIRRSYWKMVQRERVKIANAAYGNIALVANLPQSIGWDMSHRHALQNGTENTCAALQSDPLCGGEQLFHLPRHRTEMMFRRCELYYPLACRHFEDTLGSVYPTTSCATYDTCVKVSSDSCQRQYKYSSQNHACIGLRGMTLTEVYGLSARTVYFSLVRRKEWSRRLFYWKLLTTRVSTLRHFF